MERGEFGFERDMMAVGAGDVAGAAGACAVLAHGAAGRLDHRRVLAHAEVIVAAPDGDASLVAGGRVKIPRRREFACDPGKGGEGSITTLRA